MIGAGSSLGYKGNHGLREARPYAPTRRVARAPLKSAGKSSPIGRGRRLRGSPADEVRRWDSSRVKETWNKLKALGRHIVCELSGCQPSLLSDINGIAAMMISAAKAARATIMESAFHRFEPQGVSGTVILAESHISIHTWPEKGYAAMDFYTCGDHTDPWLACQYAAETLRAKSVLATELKRGIEKSDGEFTHVLSRNHDARARVRSA